MNADMALGMGGGRFNNSQITASSYIEGVGEPYNARLRNTKCWISQSSDTSSYLQIKLYHVPTSVTRIDTQGCLSHSAWVTEYTLEYSTDGRSWINYTTTDGLIKVSRLKFQTQESSQSDPIQSNALNCKSAIQYKAIQENAMQCKAIPYHIPYTIYHIPYTIPYHTIQNMILCSTVQYNATQCISIQYNKTVQCNTTHAIRYDTIQYNTKHYITLQTIQYDTII